MSVLHPITRAFAPLRRRLVAVASARLRLMAVLSLHLIGTKAIAEPVDWPTLGFVQVSTNIFSAPTSITHAGDGSQRLFITERGGRIRIFQGSNVLSLPFFDITNKVLTTGQEQGLLSVAFPPGYSSKRYFYVDYTRKPDGAVVISRFHLTADNNLANTNSEQIILLIPKTNNFHNGG